MMLPPPLPRYVDIIEAPPPVEAPPPAPATLSAQLGSYSTLAKAEDALRTVQLRTYSDPPPVRVRAVRIGGRQWFRVIAGPLDPAGADRLCDRLRVEGEPCWVRETDPTPATPSE